MNSIMNSKWILLAAILAGACHLAIPSGMIIEQEHVLKKGTAYKFQTAPVDPVDIFRGRYVQLNFDAAIFQAQRTYGFTRGQRIYATLTTNKNGFATVADLYPSPPAQKDSIAVTFVIARQDRRIVLHLPFSRYYMNEALAPKAEQAYATLSRTGRRDAYAFVRVLDGRGVLEELYLADKPVAEYLASNGTDD